MAFRRLSSLHNDLPLYRSTGLASVALLWLGMPFLVCSSSLALQGAAALEAEMAVEGDGHARGRSRSPEKGKKKREKWKRSRSRDRQADNACLRWCQTCVCQLAHWGIYGCSHYKNSPLIGQC